VKSARSPNTSWVTHDFFKTLRAELPLARVRCPTDNALTERFYGTVKQEKIYLVAHYTDETSAREELGLYIRFYNESRTHQAPLIFTQLTSMRPTTRACCYINSTS
jgi:transposase InsO family protein